jgi:hypothetical protein
VLDAGIHDIACTPDRARLEIARATAHRGADVVDDLCAVDRMVDDARVAEIADDHLHADRPLRCGVGATDQDAHSLPARPQRLHQCTAEKPRRAGHQCVHRFQWTDSRVQLATAFQIRLGAHRFHQCNRSSSVFGADRRRAALVQRACKGLRAVLDARGRPQTAGREAQHVPRNPEHVAQGGHERVQHDANELRARQHALHPTYLQEAVDLDDAVRALHDDAVLHRSDIP